MDTKQPEALRLAGMYPQLPRATMFATVLDGGFAIGNIGVYTPDQMRAYADATCAVRAATTASAPVVLPEPVAAQSRFADTPSDTWDSCSVEHARSFGGVGYEVRYLYTEQQVRAMLAAAPKPPAHEPLRCSCHTCWPIAADDPASTFMRFCPACGNKRCPKANDHRHACTGSNEPGQPGSAYQLTGGITAAQKGDAHGQPT